MTSASRHTWSPRAASRNFGAAAESTAAAGGTDVSAILGESPAVRKVLQQLRQVAATDSTVLLLGETGTGKELLASEVHQLSARRGHPMVRVNCAAIPSTLIESELFGREKGAFTGALARQVGRFELATRSTIFLDEIGDLSAEVQVKLLRVLEERRIERLGSPQSISVDVRIVAATHRDLGQLISAEYLSRRPLLPHECLSHSPTTVARPLRGHLFAGVAFRR